MPSALCYEYVNWCYWNPWQQFTKQICFTILCCKNTELWQICSPPSSSFYTHFTQRLRPLCLPCATTKLARSPLKAQQRPKACLGGSRVAQRTFRPCHGRHGRREVLSMFKAVAQRSPRRSVVHRSLKVGRKNTYASPCSQNGCTGQSLVAP